MHCDFRVRPDAAEKEWLPSYQRTAFKGIPNRSR
jgi:hypothetical protein